MRIGKVIDNKDLNELISLLSKQLNFLNETKVEINGVNYGEMNDVLVQDKKTGQIISLNPYVVNNLDQFELVTEKTTHVLYPNVVSNISDGTEVILSNNGKEVLFKANNVTYVKCSLTSGNKICDFKTGTIYDLKDCLGKRLKDKMLVAGYQTLQTYSISDKIKNIYGSKDYETTSETLAKLMLEVKAIETEIENNDLKSLDALKRLLLSPWKLIESNYSKKECDKFIAESKVKTLENHIKAICKKLNLLYPETVAKFVEVNEISNSNFREKLDGLNKETSELAKVPFDGLSDDIFISYKYGFRNSFVIKENNSFKIYDNTNKLLITLAKDSKVILEDGTVSSLQTLSIKTCSINLNTFSIVDHVTKKVDYPHLIKVTESSGLQPFSSNDKVVLKSNSDKMVVTLLEDIADRLSKRFMTKFIGMEEERIKIEGEIFGTAKLDPYASLTDKEFLSRKHFEIAFDEAVVADGVDESCPFELKDLNHLHYRDLDLPNDEMIERRIMSIIRKVDLILTHYVKSYNYFIKAVDGVLYGYKSPYEYLYEKERNGRLAE